MPKGSAEIPDKVRAALIRALTNGENGVTNSSSRDKLTAEAIKVVARPHILAIEEEEQAAAEMAALEANRAERKAAEEADLKAIEVAKANAASVASTELAKVQ